MKQLFSTFYSKEFILQQSSKWIYNNFKNFPTKMWKDDNWVTQILEKIEKDFREKIFADEKLMFHLSKCSHAYFNEKNFYQKIDISLRKNKKFVFNLFKGIKKYNSQYSANILLGTEEELWEDEKFTNSIKKLFADAKEIEVFNKFFDNYQKSKTQKAEYYSKNGEYLIAPDLFSKVDSEWVKKHIQNFPQTAWSDEKFVFDILRFVGIENLDTILWQSKKYFSRNKGFFLKIIDEYISMSDVYDEQKKEFYVSDIRRFIDDECYEDKIFIYDCCQRLKKDGWNSVKIFLDYVPRSQWKERDFWILMFIVFEHNENELKNYLSLKSSLLQESLLKFQLFENGEFSKDIEEKKWELSIRDMNKGKKGISFPKKMMDAEKCFMFFQEAPVSSVKEENILERIILKIKESQKNDNSQKLIELPVSLRKLTEGNLSTADLSAILEEPNNQDFLIKQKWVTSEEITMLSETLKDPRSTHKIGIVPSG